MTDAVMSSPALPGLAKPIQQLFASTDFQWFKANFGFLLHNEVLNNKLVAAEDFPETLLKLLEEDGGKQSQSTDQTTKAVISSVERKGLRVSISLRVDGSRLLIVRIPKRLLPGETDQQNLVQQGWVIREVE